MIISLLPIVQRLMANNFQPLLCSELFLYIRLYRHVLHWSCKKKKKKKNTFQHLCPDFAVRGLFIIL